MNFNSALNDIFEDNNLGLPKNDDEFLKLLQEQGLNTEERAPI